MNAILKLKTSQSAFERAARQVLEFKAIEDDAKARRIEAEEILVRMVEGKTEGTVHEEDGNLKVTVTFKVTRTVDAAKVTEDWNKIPELVKDAFTWKPDLVIKHMRALETANVDAYAVLAQYITTKPAKPSVSIKEVA
jgi:hypothetical protein